MTKHYCRCGEPILDAAGNVAAPEITNEMVGRAFWAVESAHHFHGHSCLCGFSSARSRSRTEHITGQTRAALQGEQG